MFQNVWVPQRVSAELLQGFVECLDSSIPEVNEERASALLSDEGKDLKQFYFVKGILKKKIQLN